MRAADRVTRLAVVVPVNDEEELLPRCLAALDVAVARLRAERPAVRVEVVVVLDDCTDRSASLAGSSPFTVVETRCRRVGAARAAGVEAATGRLGRGRPARLWIASTDADSAVPAHWLTHQVALAEAGADLVIGTVRPDFDDLSPAQRAAWVATHPVGHANGHVHGANLGIRGDLYLAAGGFPGVAEHEDVGLVERARDAGARVVASDGGRVLTSGRTTGRTPGGYARHLREDLVRTAGTG
ncbi:glycosyltransferase [Oerskovia gallyi]|uniref:4,4'-diaponeurosporenoate glycosyltransferase n=1 Tax=Oerskovia gallyi TaxID=2762226 RepID=A0ABR8UZ59_9CELL|nr:glycosyltransferase [Oerskovia gallyi]MBD7997351.1 glycosyltransferase [Oerskovia gallyi]